MQASSTPSLIRPATSSLFVGLFLILFSVIFNYTLSMMASPYIVGDLGGSNSIATYTVSFFALGNALGIPLGRIIVNRGRTVLFLTMALLLFALFSWACSLSFTYPLFNTSRFLQGFVSGPLYAIAFHLFSTLQPKEKKDLFISTTLTIFTIGPVLGASFGGWIAYEWDWRYVFYLNVPLLSILALFLAWRLRGFDSVESLTKAPFDKIGYLTYFVGIFSLGCLVILGQELDWFRSPLIITMAITGLSSFIFFIIWELNHPYPLLYIPLLKNSVLTFALLNLAVLFSIYFGTVILLALWLNLWVNYTPSWIGVLLATMAVSGLVPFFLIEQRMRSVDNRIYLILAIVLIAASCLHTMTFNVQINFGRIAFSRFLAGMGLALFLAPIFRLCFHRLQEKDMLHVLSLFQVVRALSSGLGAAFYSTLWLRRQVFFYDRLGSRITPASTETQVYFSKAEQIHLEGNHAIAQLEHDLEREATSLALDDCFYFMVWVLVALLLSFAFTLFLKRNSFITK